MMRSWRALLLVLCLAGLAPSRAATPAAGPDRLRALIRFPKLDMEIQILGFTPDDGFAALQDAAERKAELARLEKELSGDDRDGELLLSIAELQGRLGRGAASEQTLQRALGMLERRREAEPQNARVLTHLGQARARANQVEEAMGLLRRAVALDPASPDYRLNLAGFLVRQSIAALLGEKQASAGSAGLSLDLLGRVLHHRPAANEVEQSSQLMSEALQMLEEAVRLAPERAEVVARRGMARSFAHYSREVLRIADGLKDGGNFPEMNDIMAALFPPDALADFRRAAELDSHDPRRLISASMAELVRNGMGRPGFLLGNADGWTSLPESARNRVRSDLDKLMSLAESSDPRIAARAVEYAGLLQFAAMNDLAGAARQLKRAIELNPSSELAWKLLMGALVAQEKFADLLPVAEQRLKLEETARNHLIVAKTLERLERLDSAEAHVLDALRLAPEEVAANLAMAALLLKKSREPDDLVMVPSYLLKAGHALGRAPARTPFLDLQFLRAFYYALSGKPDMARQILNQVLKADPDNAQAREILAVLGDTTP